jgi:hypothetical protein
MANLESIVRELESERDRLDKAIQALSSLNGTSSNNATRPQSGRRTMSAAARRKIAAAQRARWAKTKNRKNVVPIGAKRNRHISAAGRARIVAAAKARWARVRAATKS